MEIHNFLAGYIKVNILSRSFAVQLPYKALRVKSIKDVNEDGNMIAICTMSDGNDYIRYIYRPFRNTQTNGGRLYTFQISSSCDIIS